VSEHTSVQAFAFFRRGTTDAGWARLSFPTPDDAIAFEQSYNAAMLPLRMHLRVAPDDVPLDPDRAPGC